jgi:4-hydroxy-3-methylbut-2-enyl diphosphate reductase
MMPEYMYDMGLNWKYHLSNGKVLYGECLRVNPNTHLVEGPEEIQREWLQGVKTVGVCGATSTPKWLMEQCREAIQAL